MYKAQALKLKAKARGIAACAQMYARRLYVVGKKEKKETGIIVLYEKLLSVSHKPPTGANRAQEKIY
jgi:hypothetical protein